VSRWRCSDVLPSGARCAVVIYGDWTVDLRAAVESHCTGHLDAWWRDRTIHPWHSIEWTIEPDGSTVQRFRCTAPTGSPCRLTCAEGCCAETWPCYSDDGEGEEREHEMVDGGSCGVVGWLAEDPESNYHGPAASVASASILVAWDGCRYVWRYPEPSTVAAAGG
jgi:hypothetical protein